MMPTLMGRLVSTPQRYELTITGTIGKAIKQYFDIDLPAPEGLPESRCTVHDVTPSSIGDSGPNWESYLDRFEAPICGDQAQDLHDYSAAHRPHYKAQRT